VLWPYLSIKIEAGWNVIQAVFPTNLNPASSVFFQFMRKIPSVFPAC